MKFIKIKFSIYLLCLFLFPQLAKAQEKQHLYSIDVNHAFGHFLLNSEFPDNISHITQNTVISWNKNTFGTKGWQRNYNYPTYGVLFSYQNNTPSFLGNLYSVMVHYTHYLYKRKISIKIADGLAFASKIYDKKDNSRNIFLTSKLLTAFILQLNIKRKICGKISVFKQEFHLHITRMAR